MSEPKPPEFDKWRPWRQVYDERRGRVVRVDKELHELPIVLELSRESGFRSRAHAWAWAKQGPTAKAQSPTTWPDGYSPTEWVGQYYHEIYAGFRAHEPDALHPVPTTMEEAKAQANALSLMNPFLVW